MNTFQSQRTADTILAERIVSASRISNKRIVMYLSSDSAAEEVVMLGLRIDHDFVDVQPLVKVHVIVIIEINVTLPDHINFTYAGVNYRIFISTESVKCFNCGETGHISKTCKKTNVNDQNNPKTAKASTSENRLNPPPVFVHGKKFDPKHPPKNPNHRPTTPNDGTEVQPPLLNQQPNHTQRQHGPHHHPYGWFLLPPFPTNRRSYLPLERVIIIVYYEPLTVL